VQPSGRESRVARIVTYDGDLAQAAPGQSITLTLADEVDVSRGDIICSADAAAGVADQFEATIVWMSGHSMLPGRSYWLKIGTKTVTATIGHPKYRLNVHTLEHLATKKLDLNDIGVCSTPLTAPSPSMRTGTIAIPAASS
jgi:bifunctional enzyme CysN/CysC